jgi:putative flippase GtrA
MPTQATAIPTRKTTAATIAGLATILIPWALQTYAKVPITPEVASAITAVISGLTAYFTNPHPRDLTPGT